MILHGSKLDFFLYYCLKFKMKSAQLLFRELVTALEGIYDKQEAESIARIVFREKLGLSRIDMALQKEKMLNEDSQNIISNISEKLLKGEPVQQVLGGADFFGLKLRVNSHVLIPRYETEELVQLVIDENKKDGLHILDIGTGSGCIAIALAVHLKNADVTGVDISQKALELAHVNAIANNVTIDLVNLDILNKLNWKKLGIFDIIVSNPPYVHESEKSQMHINVLNYEPHQALFVPDNNPLLYYEMISELAASHLTKNGKLYFEINEAYGNNIKQMLEDKGFIDIIVNKDL